MSKALSTLRISVARIQLCFLHLHLLGPSMSFPTSAAVLTKLLQSFPKPNLSDFESSSLQTRLSFPVAKPSLLTLHAIYPTVLLPALDLIDRGAVTRLSLRTSSVRDERVCQRTSSDESHSVSIDSGLSSLDAERKAHAFKGSTEDVERVLYYVKSSGNRELSGQDRMGRRAEIASKGYEVRPMAWSCSCAAFAFASFNDHGSLDKSVFDEQTNDDWHNKAVASRESPLLVERITWNGKGEGLAWGGLMVDKGMLAPPMCKHLLACIISECWDIANDQTEWRVVERDEMAGWGAGWGG